MPKQTKADAARQGGSEAAPGDSALDDLLNEFETKAQPESEPKSRQSGGLGALKPVVDFARQEMERRTREDETKALDDVASFVSEPDELKFLDRDAAIGMLEAYARKMPAFAKAFQNRGDDPESWNKQLATARDWVKETVGKWRNGNDETRKDIEAATAAVRGTSNRAAEEKPHKPAELFAMSDMDFEKVLASERAKVAEQP